uniref:Neurotransmitter-gated ion-channel ligand-binding domain-containing protein n=1 Tax=Plectus sambesii TaxID=2011161 RepID=A0A914VLJ3_9BILA
MGGKGALQVVFVVILLFHKCVSEQPSDQLHPALSSNRKRLPIIDSPPLPVRIGFYLESLGNFRSTEMSFDVDLYLYLSWRDPALNHTEPDYVLIHDERLKDELWLPDLYFANAKSAQFHTVTVPNFNMFID